MYMYDLPLVCNSNMKPNVVPFWNTNFNFKSDWPGTWSFKFTQGQGLPKYYFLLMFNGNIWHNQAPLEDIWPQHLSDLDYDLSRSLKVKYDGASGVPYMVSY